MTAKIAHRCAMALWLCLACEGPSTDPPEGSTGLTTAVDTDDPTSTATTEDLPVDVSCEVEGERRCAINGRTLYTCESAHWISQNCRSVCRKLEEPSCSLGCIITADEEYCLCFASELPC